MNYTIPSLINAYLSLAYGVSYGFAKENGFEDTHIQNQINTDFLNAYNIHSIDTVNFYSKLPNKIYS